MRLYSWEGYGLFKTGQPGRALMRYDEFFERFAAPPDSLRFWFRHMHRQRGYLYYAQGNLSAAARDYVRALSYATSTRKRADLSVDLGYVFQRMRAFRTAQRHYRRAGALLQSLDANDEEIRRRRAEVLLARADLLLEEPSLTKASLETDWREVIQHCERALALLGSDAQGEEVLLARAHLADAHGSLGEIAAAHRHLGRALRLARKRGSGHWQFWLTYKRGRLYLKTGALKQAEASFQQALAKADQARHADYRRRLLESLGLLYELKRAPARAEGYYRRAIAVVEDYRTALGATEWAAQAFSQWQAPYRGLVRALLAQERPRAAFRVLERSRARHLRDLRTQARMLGTLSTGQRRRFDSLTTALSEVRTRLGSDTLRAPVRAPVRARLSRQETRLIAARQALAPSTAPPRDSLSFAALQQTLAPRHRALISYFIDDPNARFGRSARSTAFVLTEDRFAAVTLPDAPADTLASLLHAVSPLLSEGNPTGMNAVQFALQPLKTLYDRLIAPLQARLPADAPLVIVPDGPLFALPFAALVTEVTLPYRYRAAPFFIRRHPITTELAASLLLPDALPEAPAPKQPGTGVAVFGKARFEDLMASEAFQTSPFDDDALPALPAVTVEVEAVRRLFADVRVAAGREATEPNLKAAMQRAKVLHVASHAFASETSPLQSAILLSPERSGASPAAQSTSDGLLYLHELPRDRLAARLVVLSGCSTARGALRPGEGMTSLQYGFRAAGVASTLSTLWPAEDRTAVRLVERFYRHLRAGQPKDVALQQAQLAFLRDARAGRRSPFFWATPVLYGDASSLELAAPPPWARSRNVTLGLALFALLAAAALFYRRSR